MESAVSYFVLLVISVACGLRFTIFVIDDRERRHGGKKRQENYWE